MLSKAMVLSMLVRFFKKGQSEKKSSPIAQENSDYTSDISDVANISSCMWAKTYDSQSKSSIVTSTHSKSQIVIIGNEMPLSSDESSTIDVCMKSSDESLTKSPKKHVNNLNLSVELVDFFPENE